jgi:hypothetical protein
MNTLRKWGVVGALAATAAFPVLAVNGTASAAPGGNSAAAHACQKGGFATLRGTDGTLFNNVGECVSYAAHGGTLEAIITTGPPSILLGPTTAIDGNSALCNVFVILSNFAPNTTEKGTITQDEDGTTQVTFTTDANGNFAGIGFSYAKFTGITLTVNGVSSLDTPVSC